ncbi:hypothetical protein EEB13_05430 [Rhodococcus sp. WS3]|uniref:hypothetical protein n=1 Tax=Rhodococcus sp. WS3 TaxID=2486271 RepID=UPI001144481B|nr:hypothetical protein [Rhodococcus sp. WS3]ROZ49367.1 hypothetical protein EEB13_05430 [Rhodococcus sp. WS3]
MAREFGKIWFSLFQDDHFCAQPRLDKLVYVALVAQPAVNYAGVLPMQLRKLRKACGGTEREIKAALIRLERNRYAFTDSDTEEILIRTFIRNDEVYKQPNLLLNALRSAAQVESPKLGAVLLDEIAKVEVPQFKNLAILKKLDVAMADGNHRLTALSEGMLEPFPEPFADDFPEGIPEPIAEGIERPGEMEPFPEGIGEPFPDPTVVVAVAVAQSPTADFKLGGREREAIEVVDSTIEPPPAHCPRHINEPTMDPCRACGDARRTRQAWDREQSDAQSLALSEELRLRAEIKTVAIDACDLCNDLGYIGTTVCDHDSERFTRARRGMELVNESLAEARAKAQAKSEDDDA